MGIFKYSFLDLKKNHGDEEMRARDLFYALWIPDLFMKKVSDDDYWYLMCPNECPGLADSYGEDFDVDFDGAREAAFASVSLESEGDGNKKNKRIRSRTS